MTKLSILYIILATLALVIAMRLTLRVSSQWHLLKTQWTWKDDILDTLFYATILAAAVFGLFKFIEILSL